LRSSLFPEFYRIQGRIRIGVDSEDTTASISDEALPRVSESADPKPDEPLYRTLPTPTSIRLLEIDLVDIEGIHCHLKIADLRDKPTFDALSYTWSDPVTVYEHPNQESEAERERKFAQPLNDLAGQLQNNGRQPETPVVFDMDAATFPFRDSCFEYKPTTPNLDCLCPIQCNNHTVMVTETLYQALLRLRQIGLDVDGASEWFSQINGQRKSRYIWIDQICIDQSNLPERNQQVAIMGQIFGKARTVIAWLGKEDALSRAAMATLVKLKIFTVKNPDKRGTGFQEHQVLFTRWGD
jgi:hypothetical protein